ncbi:Alpha/Beta hydrolase protein [Limtongia smithiae]|uniref:Alpha/Beta hydrolase protein n=1 Tax=Limtongia smithiae TaxID=1125753 RepID=UPI0034CEC78D
MMHLVFAVSSSTRVRRVALLSVAALVLPALFFAGIVGADGTAADYFVPTLPGAPAGIVMPHMYAGHIEINPEHNGNMFFWMCENEHIAEKPRTIIWLNGGPGCSSMDGAAIELGPFRVAEGGHLYLNEGRWNQYANVLFVDNPLGTGFSYVDTDSYVHELDEMAADFLKFMDKFFAIFPQYFTEDLYIAGESYAGMYIPYIADAILARNANATTTGAAAYPLKGIMLGNSWVDPVRQYLSYLPYAYSMNLLQGGTPAAARVEAQVTKCVNKIQEGGPVIEIETCEEVLDIILEVSQDKSQPNKKYCHNMYDVRKFDTYPACGGNWPDDLVYVTPYLRTQAVIDALHVNPDKKTGWTECSGAVSRAFSAHNSRPAIELLPGILEQIPVLMFNGDQDMICNHLGNEDFISQMKFNGGLGFEETPGGTWAPREEWTLDNEAVGLYQAARNLTYVLIYNASHMVPVDQPLAVRDMMHRFIGLDYNFPGVTPPQSSVGGNSTAPGTGDGSEGDSSREGDNSDDDEAQKKIKDATRAAYFRAGELALIIVALAAAGFAVFVIYQRRQDGRRGYRTVGFAKQDQVLRMEDGSGGSSSSTDVLSRESNELDELVVESPIVTSDEIERRIMFDASSAHNDARRVSTDSASTRADEEDEEATGSTALMKHGDAGDAGDVGMQGRGAR